MKILALKNFEDEEHILSIINEIYQEDKIILYVMCDGGLDDLRDLLVREINLNKDKVKLYGSRLASNGFWFFYYAECEKEILSDCMILIHRVDATWKVLKSKDTNYTKMIEHQNNIDRVLLKQFLTSKELKIFDRGEDVYIYDEDRIKLIFGL